MEEEEDLHRVLEVDMEEEEGLQLIVSSSPEDRDWRGYKEAYREDYKEGYKDRRPLSTITTSCLV